MIALGLLRCLSQKAVDGHCAFAGADLLAIQSVIACKRAPAHQEKADKLKRLKTVPCLTANRPGWRVGEMPGPGRGVMNFRRILP